MSPHDEIRHVLMSLGSEKMIKLGKAVGCEQAHMCYSKGELATYISLRLVRLIQMEGAVKRVRMDLKALGL